MSPKLNALVRVAAVLKFLRSLMGGLKSGGRWSVTETAGVAEVKSGLEYKFPGQVVPGANGADVEYFWAGGPFQFFPLGGRVTGSGWVMIKVVHSCLWEVGEVSLFRTDTLKSVELVVEENLIDADPAVVFYRTDPDLEIIAQNQISTAYYPIAYIKSGTASHLPGAGTGVREFGPFAVEIDES